METRRQCAFNVTRSALLSERVLEVKEALAPEQLLPLFLNGPAMVPQSGLWLREAANAMKAPRLFAFEVAYLDENLKIVEAGEVGPAREFPPMRSGVESVLILPDHRLSESGTEVGDQVRICEETELAGLVSTAPQFRDIRVQLQSETPPPKGEADQMFSPAFVFQPFSGSLIHIPEASARQASTSEYFLAFRSAEVDAETGSAEPPEAASVQSATAVSGADSSTQENEGAQTIHDESGQEGSEMAVSPLDLPHFHRPEPIRFLDPATAGEADYADGGPAAKGTRESAQLSPELIAAIQRVDEERRRDQEKRKTQDGNREKRPKGKKRRAGKQELTRLFEKPLAEEEKRDEAEPAPKPVEAPAAKTAEVEAAPKLAEGRKTESLELELEVQAEPAVPPLSQSAEEIHAFLAEALESGIPARAREAAYADPELIEDAQAMPSVITPAASSRQISKQRIEEQSSKAKPVVEEVREEQASGLMRGALAEGEAARRPAEAPVQPVVAPELPAKKEAEKVPAAPKKPSVGMRLRRFLSGESSSLSGNRRKGERMTVPGLVAYYWSGGAPKAHEIANISQSGFYVRTSDVWSPDTLVKMTLQRPKEKGDEQRRSIGVLARVVRIDENGVGHEFVTTEQLRSLRSFEIHPEEGTSRKDLQKFLEIK